MAIPIPIIGNLIDNVFGFFTMSKTAKIKRRELKDTAKISAQRRDQELTQAKHNAKVDRIKRADNAETSYDRIAQENARETYIDEILIIWVLTIVTLMFIPDMQPYVIKGFKALDEHVPVWFQLVFVGCFISKLGLRFLFKGRTLFGKGV